MKLFVFLFTQLHCRQLVYTAHITDDRPIPVNPANVKLINVKDTTLYFKFMWKLETILTPVCSFYKTKIDITTVVTRELMSIIMHVTIHPKTRTRSVLIIWNNWINRHYVVNYFCASECVYTVLNTYTLFSLSPSSIAHSLVIKRFISKYLKVGYILTIVSNWRTKAAHGVDTRCIHLTQTHIENMIVPKALEKTYAPSVQGIVFAR